MAAPQASDDNGNGLAASDEGRAAQWPILVGLAALSLGLLLAIGSQTEPGPVGGGWWNAPALAPAIALLISFAAAALGALTSRDGCWIQRGAGRVWRRAFALSVTFILSLWSISYVGYGLATLLLATGTGFIAGYRNMRLAVISLGISLTMILIFRVILGVWFPQAELFKVFPVLQPLAGIL